MVSDIIRRVAALFSHSSEKSAQQSNEISASPEFQIDPMWHGDHWQNLLSSPMDARHYVMEDWSVAPAVEWAPTVPTSSRR
jgi:hypothetical protein